MEYSQAQVINADCFEAMQLLPDASIDLILCDLPYNTTQNKWDSSLPLLELWAHYRRLLKPAGAVILTGQGIFTARLILSNEAWFRYKIVWEKSKATNFLNAKHQPLRKHEDICVFYPGKPTYHPQMTAAAPYDKGTRKDQLTGSYGDFAPHHIRSEGSRHPTDVIYFKTAESEAERTVWHPTQKPVALMEYLIRTYSDEGQTVMDNTMGSGTCGVAAATTGRRFIGIEKDEGYFQIASRRIADACGKPATLSLPSPEPTLFCFTAA